MFDYTICYKSVFCDYSAVFPDQFDVFVSAYNDTDRVRSVFDRVNAKRKIWVIHNEYRFGASEIPSNGEVFHCDDSDEAIACRDLLEYSQVGEGNGTSLCIDITGFVAPYLMFFLALLWRAGRKIVECVYSEPMSYLMREATAFSEGSVSEVREVAGFGGVMEPDLSSDWLVIAAGYDDRLISEVAQFKDSASKAIILGFPSSRADMYQQNLLRAHLAEDSIGPVPERLRLLAPAYDPFVTASVLSGVVNGSNGLGPVTNLYLAPLSTKAQALGFVLFYLHEMRGKSTSIIFPYCAEYPRATDRGISRTWRYWVQFP